MQLDAGTLLLRPPREDDVERLVEAVTESRDTVGLWLPWADGYGPDEARAYIERSTRAIEDRTAFDLLVIDAPSGELLGGCGLNRIDPLFRSGNLGYWTRTTRQGRGIAVTAARRVARFGFEELDLVRIEIVAAVDNVPSRRVAEKIGAVREAVLRNRIVSRGVPCDAVVFSLIPGDLG
jgi:RimJ/RimL family protein N-acetyltransferase